jgi:hypothetical protein
LTQSSFRNEQLQGLGLAVLGRIEYRRLTFHVGLIDEVGPIGRSSTMSIYPFADAIISSLIKAV